MNTFCLKIQEKIELSGKSSTVYADLGTPEMKREYSTLSIIF